MKNVFVFCVLVLSLISCQEIVNVDLNSSNPRLVVEGEINTKTGPYRIKLSRTTNFFDNNVFAPELGATLVITDNAGTTDTLKELGSGIYLTTIISGKPGRNYNLFISTKGQKYTASNNIPDSVSIDSLVYTPIQNQIGNYRFRCVYSDPAGINNYYGFRTHILRQILVRSENDIIDNRFSIG